MEWTEKWGPMRYNKGVKYRHSLRLLLKLTYNNWLHSSHDLCNFKCNYRNVLPRKEGTDTNRTCELVKKQEMSPYICALVIIN